MSHFPTLIESRADQQRIASRELAIASLLLARISARWLEGAAGVEVVAVGLGLDREADLATDVLHRVVVGQNDGSDAFELLVAANLHEPPEQLRAQSLLLPMVAHQQRELGVIL